MASEAPTPTGMPVVVTGNFGDLVPLARAIAAPLAAVLHPGDVAALVADVSVESCVMGLALRWAGATVKMHNRGDTQEGFELKLSATNVRLIVTIAEGNAAAQAAADKLGLVHVTASVQNEADGQVHVRLAGLPVESHATNGNASQGSGFPASATPIRAAVPESSHNAARLKHCRVCIVGGGPSGLAVAACLRNRGVTAVVIEHGDRIAPLWQERTYDGQKQHLPKSLCELPLMAISDKYPEYITGNQYIDYLEGYAAMFDIRPEFNSTVVSARYDDTSGLWCVRARAADPAVSDMEYIARWLVVATGENAQRVVPNIPGLRNSFTGEVMHIGDYEHDEAYRGKRVLVVGSGNCAMDVALDLCAHGARPIVVARDAVHVLPRKMFGRHTLEVASMLLERWRLPRWFADKILALTARFVLGDVAKLGLRRPANGPLERSGTRVHTRVFDFGALEHIRAGDIDVAPGVARFCGGKAELVNGQVLDIDAVVLATGRRSNLPQAEWHGDRSGYPATAFPYGWRGQCGLYAVGFSRRSFGGAPKDAVRVAEDIVGAWRDLREGAEPAAGHGERKGVHVIF